MEPEAEENISIIVGIDGTERGEDALALAHRVASADDRILLAAVPHWRPEEAAGWLDRAAAGQPGLTVEKRIVDAPSPARGLRALAETTGAKLVVVGSTHRGWLGRILPGSVGERLLHDAPCAIAIAPRGLALSPHASPRTIAAAYDASVESEAAVRFAAEVADSTGASLRILTVAEGHLAGYPGPLATGAYLDFARSKHERLTAALDHLDGLLGTLPASVRVETWLLDGEPGRRLVDETEGDVDLLVLGSRGYGTTSRAVRGSVLNTVIRTASCAVAIAPLDKPAARSARRAGELAGASS